MLALDRHGLDLLLRGSLGEDPVDAESGADRLGHVGVVAGDHHDARDPCAPKRTDHAWRVRPDRVVDHDRSRDLAVDPNEDAR